MRQETAAKRDQTVCTKLSKEEEAMLDRLRGSVSRSAYLRLLVIAAGKRNGA